MRNFIFCCFLFAFGFTIGQSKDFNKKDTVLLKTNLRQNSYAIRFKRNSLNDLENHIPHYDSVLVGVGRSSNASGIKIFHLRDSSSVTIYNVPKALNEKQSKGNRIICSYLFMDIQNLCINVYYNADSTISRLSVNKYNLLKKGYSFTDLFFDGRISSNKENSLVVNCGELGSLELKFNIYNQLIQLSIYKKEKNIFYEFGSLNSVKRYFEVNKVNMKFTEELFHKNGNLKKYRRGEIIGNKNDYSIDLQFDEKGNKI